MDPVVLTGTAVGIWLLITLAVAFYAQSLGYSFWPLLIVGLVFGPIGWAIVLLGVALTAPRRTSQVR